MFDLDKYHLTEDEWKRIRGEWKKHDEWVDLCRKVIPPSEFIRMTPAERANNYVRMWLEVTRHLPNIDIDDLTNRLIQAGRRI